jgi:integrase
MCLRDLTRQTLQQYFSGMAAQASYPTISKIRDVLSSILRSAVNVEYLNKNPMEGLQLPPDKRARQSKPTITPEQFHELVELVPEFFQSVQHGKPMNDQNVLKRHIKPAARKLGLPFINWQCLRTSHATWLVQAGADPKSVQAQMRHSRISTTMEIYAQSVPQAQRRALEQLSEFAKAGAIEARSNSRSVTVQ